ncbi:YIF1-domain-containing protein [Phlyctochytrium arcticum]|nr:YIF1-domain-containing protein [Phlyctochytrium arcticum]
MYNSGPPTPSWSPPPIQAPVPQHAQRPTVGFARSSTAGSFPGSPQPASANPGSQYGGQQQQQQYQQQQQQRVPLVSAGGSYGVPSSAAAVPFPSAHPTTGYTSQANHRQPTHSSQNYSNDSGNFGGMSASASGSFNPQRASVAHNAGPSSFYPQGSAAASNASGAMGGGFMQGAGMGGPGQMGGTPAGQPGIHGQQPGYFGSNLINEFQTSAAGQLGMQLGGKAFQQAQDNLNQNWSRWMNIPHLKYYFNVSNSYVFSKLRLLIFPFRHQSWTRLVRRSEQNGAMEGFKPPREDLNAPDLYIPVMALVTYILLVGVRLGLADAAAKDGSRNPVKSFSPDVLGMTGTTAFFIIFSEVLFIKLGFYLLSVTTEVPWLDLVGYTGYKFIGIIITLVIQLFFPINWAVYGAFGYSMCCLAFFTLRTLKYIMLPEGYNPIDVPTRQRRIQFLFLVAGVQMFLSWVMLIMSR